mgnify:FL=1
MPNLVGIGNSQVPTNAMLGGLAYQDSVGEINLDKIKAQTGDTAVDIFVYDTRKDSDGGAWRYRTKNLSWYNEGASATRGSRKEFPAVAVIVMESTQCTIYDADDPNLSMWMIFNFASGSSLELKSMFYAGGKAVFALNGMICFGGDDSWKDGLTQVKLLEDTAMWRNASYIAYWSGNIADRNKTNHWGEFTDDAAYKMKADAGMAQLVMTVLDNAPINPNTGLPQPTVVCATRSGSGGVQIVTATDGNDFIGKVFRRTGHGYPSAMKIDVDGNKLIATHNGPTSGNAAETFNLDTMSQLGDGGQGPIHGDNSLSSSETYYGYGTIITGNTHMPFKTNNFGNTIRPVVNGDDIYFGYNYLHRIREHKDPMLAMTNQIRSGFNTGWMPANCKRCMLASTDSTNLSGADLLTNGYFDSNANNWTADNGFSVSQSSGRLVVNSNGNSGSYFGAVQSFNTVVGKTYVLAVDIYSQNHNAVVRLSGSSIYFTVTGLGTGHHTFQFTSDQVSHNLQVGSNVGGGGNREQQFNEIHVREADPDRAIQAQGFITRGTVPKSPVAPGAELMAYGPFASNTDMLVQGYSGDLNYGTGDFYYMIWVNISSHSPLQGIWSRQDNDQSSGNRIQFQTVPNGDGQLNFYGGHGNGNISGMKVQLNTWEHLAMVRRDNLMYWYLNGENVSSYGDATNYTNDKAVLRVGGLSLTSTSAFSGGAYAMSAGKIALFKTGAEAPTPEQMREIYQDEKKLFAPNTKCDFGSTNNYVRALEFDKDTDTLHVGTDVGRSDFNGLVRINTTSTPVTTVISASNGLIAEQ